MSRIEDYQKMVTELESANASLRAEIARLQAIIEQMTLRCVAGELLERCGGKPIVDFPVKMFRMIEKLKACPDVASIKKAGEE